MDHATLADAIQEDVSAEEQVATLTSPQSPRMRALAAIEEKNRERLEAEMGVKFSDEQLADPVDPPAAEPAPVVEPEPEPEPKTRKVKVDGIEKEVTDDELIRTYQKNAAADRRLEEAARLLQQAEQLAAQTTATPQPAAAPALTDAELRKEAAETLAKMYEGDQDAAAEALVKLLAKAKGGDQPTPTPAPQINEDVLTAKVLERMAVNTAFERVRTDYPDLLADPDLEMLAAMKIDQQVAAGKPRAEAMLSVAEDLYKSLGKTPTGRQAPAPAPENTRLKNKERLDNVPTASATAMPKQSPNENPDPSSVIAELASRRLGQSLPRTFG